MSAHPSAALTSPAVEAVADRHALCDAAAAELRRRGAIAPAERVAFASSSYAEADRMLVGLGSYASNAAAGFVAWINSVRVDGALVHALVVSPLASALSPAEVA